MDHQACRLEAAAKAVAKPSVNPGDGIGGSVPRPPAGYGCLGRTGDIRHGTVVVTVHCPGEAILGAAGVIKIP